MATEKKSNTARSASGRTGTSAKKVSSRSSAKTAGKSTAAKKSTAGKKAGQPSGARGSSSSRSTARREVDLRSMVPHKKGRPIRREVGGVVCLLLAIFAGLGYFNIKAVFITWFCSLIKGLFGYGFWIMPPALLLSSGILIFHRNKKRVARRVVSTLLVPFFVGALVHLLAANGMYTMGQIKLLWTGGLAMSCGGVLSGWFAIVFSKLFSRIGAALVFLIGLQACNMIITKNTPYDIVMGAKWLFSSLIESVRTFLHNRPSYEEPTDLFGGPEEITPVIRRPSGRREAGAPKSDKPGIIRRRAPGDIDIPLEEDPSGKPDKLTFDPQPAVRPPHEILTGETGKPEPEAAEIAPEEEFPSTPAASAVPSEIETAAPDSAVPAAPVPLTIEEKPRPKRVKAAQVTESVRKLTPEEVASQKQKKSEAAIDADLARKGIDAKNYEYPPIDLLDRGSGVSNADVNSELQQTRDMLDDTLQSFGIDARIINVTRGPSITRYELELSRGVKLSKLTNLADDIALTLGASSVRIAPIPGRSSVVGVEVPNQLVTSVPIREVIDSKEFKNHASKVAFSLGKDISGRNIVGNIAKLPHLLIAGTTGSGKSVCTNSLVISLLYKSSPEDVRLIMVDPKVVEFGIYNGIPHLLIPVVTDPKKAAGALQWAVNEMMRRYRSFAEIGVRDLASYNQHMLENNQDKLPQIVVIIDELADLMLVAAKEVEESICRVAQMGRAAGMHLVIATQRPSADVITGLMKANIPSRIAFAVASSLESRIILDNTGAEKLVGKGDMLYSPVGSGKPMRIQGCMITDEEVARVVEFVKENSTANYDNEIMNAVDANAENAGKKSGKDAAAAAPSNRASTEGSAAEADELLPAAVEIVIETGMASVSMLQRRLKLGYSRAARLVDQMEERKIVGPFEGAKPRQVLVSKEDWALRKESILGGNADAPSESEIRAEEFAEAMAMNEAAPEEEAEYYMDEETDTESELDEAPF